MSFLSSLLNALPGAVAQGLIWGLMAIGVYITFRILDVADLTVDGSLATGGAPARIEKEIPFAGVLLKKDKDLQTLRKVK